MSPFSAAPFPTDNIWRKAVVREVEHPTPHAVILRLEVPERTDHLPGQYYIVRLTADDGYTASRSYSLASPPSSGLSELYVERLPEGEVSGFLGDVVEVGDLLEVRGPIGGWFVWDGVTPALAVGGGSGVVPLVAMLRHARHLGVPELLTVVATARTRAELPFAQELIEAGAVIALSRENHHGPSGVRVAGRLSTDDLRPLIDGKERFFVCGSAGFAEVASHELVDIGVPAPAIRVERFGPTT